MARDSEKYDFSRLPPPKKKEPTVRVQGQRRPGIKRSKSKTAVRIRL